MPRHVEKRGSGKKPYKIVDPGGQVRGSSTSKAKAESAARAANAAMHGWHPTGKKRGRR